MKKSIIILTSFFLLVNIALFSQDSNDEKEMFPKQGNIGIGLDADPFLTYIGNLFSYNEEGRNSLNLRDNTLYFRYFLMDDIAVRMRTNMFFDKDVRKFNVRDDDAFINDPLTQKEVQDRRTEFDNEFNIWLGGQYFIGGDSKFRGFAGADLGYGYGKSYMLYEYGNTMNEINDAPTTVVNWNNGATGNAEERNLEAIDNLYNRINLGLFTGGEYYFRPNFCLGIELGLNYGLTFPGERYTIYETMVNTEYVEMTTDIGRGRQTRRLETGTPYLYGNLYFFFHF